MLAARSVPRFPRRQALAFAIVAGLFGVPSPAGAQSAAVSPIVNPPVPSTSVVVSLAEFLTSGVSVNEAFRRALTACRTRHAATLLIPPGRYVFDDPSNPSGFHIAIDQQSDLTIDGQGAELVFHSLLPGIIVVNSQRLVIRNLLIDYDFRLASPGIVHKSSTGEATIVVPNEYPVAASTPVLAVSRFNIAQRAWVKSPTEVYYPTGLTLTAPQTFSSPGFAAFNDGDEVILRHHGFDKHAFYLGTGAADIAIEDVTIYSAPGMGFVVWSADRGFRFSRCIIARRDLADRLISTAADGIHITTTRGDIIIEDNDFSGQGDDSLNLNGLWLTLTQKLAANQVTLNRGTYGLIQVGDVLRFVRSADLSEYASRSVTALSSTAGPDYTVTLGADLPGSAAVGDLVVNLTRNNSTFVVRRNTFHDHRARGMLIQSPNGLIENNVVRDVTMNGLHLTTDNRFFQESGGLDTVTVRGNRIQGVGYGSPEIYGGGRHMAAISVVADVPSGISGQAVHRHLMIEDNVIVDAPGLGILVASSDDVTVRNNILVRTNQRSFGQLNSGVDIDAAAQKSIMVTRASNVAVSGNRQVLTSDMFDSGVYVDGRNTANIVVSGNTVEPDTSAPQVTITAPPGGVFHSTTVPVVMLAGTASDNVRIQQLTWSNARGGSGTVTDPGAWTVANIPLEPGHNAITITARDDVGNVGSTIVRASFFTDALSAAATPVRAIHLLDLAEGINAARAAEGLQPQPWSAGTPQAGGTIRASHVNDLRSGLAALCDIVACAAFSRSAVEVGAPIRAIHLQELREVLKSLP